MEEKMQVPSKDPCGPSEKKMKLSPCNTTPKDSGDDTTEEDNLLANEIELCINILKEDKTQLYLQALNQLRSCIREATTSVTSVPKPLKLLKPYFSFFKEIYEKINDDEVKKLCADIISILCMTMGEKGECLEYYLCGLRDIECWGHDYVRHLTDEIAHIWGTLTSFDSDYKNEVLQVVKSVLPYHMSHNAETEACDLAMEVECFGLLEQCVDEESFARVALYLSNCVLYVCDPENVNLLKCVFNIYLKYNRYPDALRVAMNLNDIRKIEHVFWSCKDSAVQKQMAYILVHQQIYLPIDEDSNTDLYEIMTNFHLNSNFLVLCRELDIMEPKIPDDIYKTHLDNIRPLVSNTDSARHNLASSFVNCLVNAAFGTDKLIVDDGSKWLYKHKDQDKISAAASLGLIMLWDVDGGLGHIDKYLYAADEYVHAGALLACGIVNCGVRSDCDPALALLGNFKEFKNDCLKECALIGLGIAYAGTCNQSALSSVIPEIYGSPSIRIASMAALACGMIAVGSCNEEIVSTLVGYLHERTEEELKTSYASLLPLAIGLCYLGRQEEADAVIEALEVLKDPFKSIAETIVDVIAYAGTGNVLKIQHLLHICCEHYDVKEETEEGKKDKENEVKNKETGEVEKKESNQATKEESSNSKKKCESGIDFSSQQAVAVLGIAVIAMGEDIGSDMSLRQFGHLMRYGEPVIRRSVPLAMALLTASNAKYTVLEMLNKYSHDNDIEVACNAIFAMGIVGSGTNNARLAVMLRQLALYHARHPEALFMVRLSQGLCHMGKGTLTLSPYHCDRQLLRPVSIAGLMATMLLFLNPKSFIIKDSFLLYTLVLAIQPKIVMTLDEDLKPLPVPVRVGQAVDIIGQPGKPKTITGFQNLTTPLLLSFGDRCELSTEEYISLSPVMEGFVILRKNPNYSKE